MPARTFDLLWFGSEYVRARLAAQLSTSTTRKVCDVPMADHRREVTVNGRRAVPSRVVK